MLLFRTLWRWSSKNLEGLINSGAGIGKKIAPYLPYHRATRNEFDITGTVNSKVLCETDHSFYLVSKVLKDYVFSSTIISKKSIDQFNTFGLSGKVLVENNLEISINPSEFVFSNKAIGHVSFPFEIKGIVSATSFNQLDSLENLNYLIYLKQIDLIESIH